MTDKKTKFHGVYGPLEDEITILKYVEKYKDIEIVSGAFKKVSIIYTLVQDKWYYY
jgi:hypothetical protein